MRRLPACRCRPSPAAPRPASSSWQGALACQRHRTTCSHGRACASPRAARTSPVRPPPARALLNVQSKPSGLFALKGGMGLLCHTLASRHWRAACSPLRWGAGDIPAGETADEEGDFEVEQVLDEVSAACAWVHDARKRALRTNLPACAAWQRARTGATPACIHLISCLAQW